MPYWDHASATHSGWRFRVAPGTLSPQLRRSSPPGGIAGCRFAVAGRLPGSLSAPPSRRGAAAPSLRSESLPSKLSGVAPEQ